ASIKSLPVRALALRAAVDISTESLAARVLRVTQRPNRGGSRRGSPGTDHPEPIGVLVRPALPGTVRVAEVDRDAGGHGESGVTAHLLALIPGDALKQFVR